MRNYILLFFGCLLFHLAGTWSLPLIDRDEPRFAEAAREMRERGDLIVPYFNNQFRFDKPPLTYWFQVASYRMFGENDFAARFPTAIAAALVTVILLAWGQQLRDDKVGWWAAIIFTLSLQTFIHGKAAVADMWLVLFVTVAHWAGWELFEATPEHRISLRAVGSTKPEANVRGQRAKLATQSSIQNLASSIALITSERGRRRFFRSADRRAADPSPGADAANHSLMYAAVALPGPVALRRDPSRLSKRK
jgi:Dolichyl-phosphate-mannose-protein mannosyltransferase